MQTTTLALAYVAAAYILASMGYLAYTRLARTPTPLKDSLSEKQQALKKESARTRANIFFVSLLGAACLLAVTKPLKRSESMSILETLYM